jgi:hypothetical protein
MFHLSGVDKQAFLSGIKADPSDLCGLVGW